MFSPTKKGFKMKDVKITISDKDTMVATVDRFGVKWAESFDFMNSYDTSIKSFNRSFSGDNYYFINEVDASLASDPVILDSFLFDIGLYK